MDFRHVIAEESAPVVLSPLALLAGCMVLAGAEMLFADLANGDYTHLFTLAAAVLICGFSWEMWNYLSLTKWIYTVPFVNRFHIFEMPVLGYAGYLPFGLECAVIADRVAGWCFCRGLVRQDKRESFGPLLQRRD